MNINLLDYNTITCDGSEKFSDELNTISHTILDIGAQTTNMITAEEKEWALGINAWLATHTNNPLINPNIRAYKSVKAKTKDIQERFREDLGLEPYFTDLTRILKLAFSEPSALEEDDRNRLAQFFWLSSYETIVDNEVKLINIPAKQFNLDSLILDATNLKLGEVASELLTNIGCIFYCQELRSIIWEKKPRMAELLRVKIFKNPSLEPIYSPSFNHADYSYAQTHMLMASTSETLQQIINVPELEKTTSKTIEEQLFEFIYQYTYITNPQESDKYKALYEELTSFEENGNSDEKNQREENLNRILELYKSTGYIRHSFCLCLLMMNKSVRSVMSQTGSGKHLGEEDITSWIKNLISKLGQFYNNDLRADMISFVSGKRVELLKFKSKTDPMWSDWNEMEVRFGLKQINHTIISQKAIEEKVKLEEAIGVKILRISDSEQNPNKTIKI